MHQLTSWSPWTWHVATFLAADAWNSNADVREVLSGSQWSGVWSGVWGIHGDFWGLTMHKHHVNLKDLKQTLSKCPISAQSDGNHNDESCCHLPRGVSGEHRGDINCAEGQQGHAHVIRLWWDHVCVFYNDSVNDDDDIWLSDNVCLVFTIYYLSMFVTRGRWSAPTLGSPSGICSILRFFRWIKAVAIGDGVTTYNTTSIDIYNISI